MKKIIAVTRMGDVCYFVDDGFSDEDITELQNVAHSVSKESLWSKAMLAEFRTEVESKLNIKLEPVSISEVIRIQ